MYGEKIEVIQFGDAHILREAIVAFSLYSSANLRNAADWEYGVEVTFGRGETVVQRLRYADKDIARVALADFLRQWRGESPLD